MKRYSNIANLKKKKAMQIISRVWKNLIKICLILIAFW